MFRGMGRTSSVTHAAGAPGGGTNAPPNALVVLVKTKDATPADVASSRSVSVPVTLVATKSWRLGAARWGLCRVAVWRTASTPRMHCLTQLRSAIDPTRRVKGDAATSRPTASWPDPRRGRTSASPRGPLLPGTRTFILRPPAECRDWAYSAVMATQIGEAGVPSTRAKSMVVTFFPRLGLVQVVRYRRMPLLLALDASFSPSQATFTFSPASGALLAYHQSRRSSPYFTWTVADVPSS